MFWPLTRAEDSLPAEHVPIPILWLLGKSGAGKTSLIRALTGVTEAEVGDGFRPCTRTSVTYDHPSDEPVVRFLDTKGLGETGYDPTEDLAACDGHSHAALILAGLDDPVQGEIAEALAAVSKRDRRKPMLLVHTGADLLPDLVQRDRARRAAKVQLAAAVGRDLPAVALAMPPGGEVEGLDTLIDRLAEMLPQAALHLRQEAARDAEAARFLDVRARVLTYAGVAGASDLAPFVGAVSVPGTQMAMLRELGATYGVRLSARTFRRFLAALGAGVAARYAALFGLRQVGKLIPVVGQTAVAAASGSVSFATTYALGRAAAYWMWHEARGDVVAEAELREVYAGALRRAGRRDD